jgi:hypothetical protein
VLLDLIASVYTPGPVNAAVTSRATRCPAVTAPSVTIGCANTGTNGDASAAVMAPSPSVSTCVHLRPGPAALAPEVPGCVPSIHAELPTG